MTAVNPTLPMELSDGTPVTNLNHPYPGVLKDHYVYVSDSNGTRREFDIRTGKNRYGTGTLGNCGRTLRNVPVVTLDVTKTLQTVDGKRARYIGKLDNGLLLFGITYAGYTGHEATELRYADGRKSAVSGQTSGDDVIVKVVEKIVYRNVYADGTIGSTAHPSEDAARQRTKYLKVRVGVLKQTFRDGKLFSAVVNSSVIGWYRSPAYPKGREATPEDYARG